MKNLVFWVHNLISVVNSVNPMGLAALTMLVILAVVSLAWYVVIRTT